MLNDLRKPLNWLIDGAARPFSFIHPNILSFGTLLLSIPGYYFLATGDSLLGSLFIVGAIFDSIDGAVARMRGTDPKLGGILDATIDRIYEGFLFLSMGIGGLVNWEILLLLYTFASSVSYIKAKAEAATATTNVGTNQFSVGVIQRGERIALLFGACILNGLFTSAGNDILIITALIVTIGSIITLLWRLIVIVQVLSKESGK